MKNFFWNFRSHIKDFKWGKRCISINCTSCNGSPWQIPFQFANGKLPHSRCRGFWAQSGNKWIDPLADKLPPLRLFYSLFLNFDSHYVLQAYKNNLLLTGFVKISKITWKIGLKGKEFVREGVNLFVTTLYLEYKNNKITRFFFFFSRYDTTFFYKPVGRSSVLYGTLIFLFSWLRKSVIIQKENLAP